MSELKGKEMSKQRFVITESMFMECLQDSRYGSFMDLWEVLRERAEVITEQHTVDTQVECIFDSAELNNWLETQIKQLREERMDFVSIQDFDGAVQCRIKEETLRTVQDYLKTTNGFKSDTETN